LRIQFEEPHLGWMLVKVNHGDIEEVFSVSNVPNDPVSELVYVLESAINGRGGEVWWHLEPGGYYLNLHAEDEHFRVKFEYSQLSMKIDRELVFEYLGSFLEVVVPLWRDLRQLQSHDWAMFGIPEGALDLISKEVKARKA